MLLREQARDLDISGMYESARLWLLNDPGRYHIHQVKGLLGEAMPTAEKADG